MRILTYEMVIMSQWMIIIGFTMPASTVKNEPFNPRFRSHVLSVNEVRNSVKDTVDHFVMICAIFKDSGALSYDGIILFTRNATWSHAFAIYR